MLRNQANEHLLAIQHAHNAPVHGALHDDGYLGREPKCGLKRRVPWRKQKKPGKRKLAADHAPHLPFALLHRFFAKGTRAQPKQAAHGHASCKRGQAEPP